jgi:hypothetical protein
VLARAQPYPVEKFALGDALSAAPSRGEASEGDRVPTVEQRRPSPSPLGNL